MKLVILYAADPVNNAMVRRLQDRFGAALRVRERQSTAGVLRRTLRRKRDPLLAKLNKLAFYAWYALALKAGVESLMRREFGGRDAPRPDLEVENINAPEVLAAVKDLAPDLIVVSGTRILKRGWLRSGIPILNAHFGMAPRYRGRFAWFWPVVEGHQDQIGATVHQVASRVDAGGVVVRERLDLRLLAEASFRGLLVAVSKLTLDCVEQAVELIASGGFQPVVPDDVSHPAYLEPGLTHYLVFRRNVRRLGTG